MPGKLDGQIHRQQQRLAANEQGWSSRWLVALREHLHLRLGELESLLAISEATLARRVRQKGPLEPAVSERLDRLLEAIGLALSVFEDPATTATWLKAPHPLLHQVSQLQHYRKGDRGRPPGAAAPAGDGAGCFGGRWLREAGQLALVLPSVVVL